MITPTQMRSATHQVSRLGPLRSIVASISLVSADGVASRGAAPWLEISRPGERGLWEDPVARCRQHRQPRVILPPNGLAIPTASRSIAQHPELARGSRSASRATPDPLSRIMARKALSNFPHSSRVSCSELQGVLLSLDRLARTRIATHCACGSTSCR
jgi:hypothetical protein